MRLTFKGVQVILGQEGIALSKGTDYRYRVNYIQGDYRTAHHTDSLEDALETGLAMTHHR